MIALMKLLKKQIADLMSDDLTWTEEQSEIQRQQGVISTTANIDTNGDLNFQCNGSRIMIDEENLESFTDWLLYCQGSER